MWRHNVLLAGPHAAPCSSRRARQRHAGRAAVTLPGQHGGAHARCAEGHSALAGGQEPAERLVCGAHRGAAARGGWAGRWFVDVKRSPQPATHPPTLIPPPPSLAPPLMQACVVHAARHPADAALSSWQQSFFPDKVPWSFALPRECAWRGKGGRQAGRLPGVWAGRRARGLGIPSADLRRRHPTLPAPQTLPTMWRRTTA